MDGDGVMVAMFGILIGLGIGIPVGYALGRGQQQKTPIDIFVEQQAKLRASELAMQPSAQHAAGHTSVTSLTYNKDGQLTSIVEKP